MELLLGALALIICKKVPSDVVHTKIDTLHNKVRILAPSSALVQKPLGAVVRLTVATRPATEDDPEPKESFVEIDQDHKAVAMNGRVASLPYTVPVVNQYAARAVREDFLNTLSKAVPDFLKDSKVQHYKEVLSFAEKMCVEREE
jgi:hypothetical protein